MPYTGLHPSFARAADNLASALFPDPRQRAAMAYQMAQTGLARQEGQRNRLDYQHLQDAAASVRGGSPLRATVADVIAAGNAQMLGKLPDTRRALVAANPDTTDNQLLRSVIGAGGEVDADNAFSIPGQDRVSARNAGEANRLQQLVNAGDIAVQQTSNAGDIAVQQTSNAGDMAALRYETSNPTTVEGIFASLGRSGDMTPQELAYNRYDNGPLADAAGAASATAGAAGGPEPLDINDAVDINKLSGTLNTLIDGALGIARDETGALAAGADIEPRLRAAWVQAAMNLMRASGYRMTTDQAVYQAKQQVFPQGFSTTAADDGAFFGLGPGTPASVSVNGQPDLSAAAVFDAQPAPAREYAPGPQSPAPANQPGSVAITMPSGQTYSGADVAETAAAHDMTPEQVIEYLMASGGRMGS